VCSLVFTPERKTVRTFSFVKQNELVCVLVDLIVKIGAIVLVSFAVASHASTRATTQVTPRLIVLSDIGNEPDDAESMVRLLVYSNDIEIEGLVAATSRHLPSSVHPELIEQRVTAYGQSLANLRKHDPRYPDAEQLRRRIRSGSSVYGMSGVGKGKDTSASRLIVEAVDRADPRPVWIAVWGGAADLAQALWTVRDTRSAKEVERFVSKLRVYSISDQDDAGPWSRAYFPNLFWVTSVHGFTRYVLGTWLGISAPQPGADSEPVSKEWLSANIRSKGPLGALYPPPAYIMEGDTPSFLNLIPNGLSSTERPDWGGWGGRYDKVSNALGLWASTVDSVRGNDGEMYLTPQATIWRWRSAFQNDFAARMAWTVTPEFKAANHAPRVMLNGRDDMAPIEIDGCPGTAIALSASGSNDPDGDALSFRWWSYREASGLFAPDVKLSADAGEETSMTIGDTARTDQFVPPESYKLHVVLEVRDEGSPQLTRYRRAIISVAGAGFGNAAETCQVKPIPPSH
jgi:hypothetical protein